MVADWLMDIIGWESIRSVLEESSAILSMIFAGVEVGIVANSEGKVKFHVLQREKAEVS